MSDEELVEFVVGVSDLEGRWRKLIPNDPDLASAWWLELERRHSEPQRHYHTLHHLAELFSFLDSPFGAAIAVERRALVEFAIFFHDAIYDPKGKTNEEDSAVLWQRFAAEAKLPQETSEIVSDWILWTKAHAAPEGTPEDALLFLDFDMAVLAKPWQSYYRYAAQIRQEYSHVPAETYASARPAYFERQLSDPTHRFYLSRGLAHLESRARQNLARECELLRAGNLPAVPASWFAAAATTSNGSSSSSPMVVTAAVVVAATAVVAWLFWRRQPGRR